MGGYLNGLIFIMFLLSIGYNNNLLLIFTLILFGMNLIWVIQTHFHLNQLRLNSLTIEDGHAQAGTPLKLYWKKPITPAEWLFELESSKGYLPVKIHSHGAKFSSGEVILPFRGRHEWKYLKVSTDLPFGLYKVWIHFPLKLTSVAYPSLISGLYLPPLRPGEAEGEDSSDKKGLVGLQGFDQYQGEHMGRISWKHYAKSGDLLVKTGEATREEIVDLELRIKLDPREKERVLSEIATQLLMCHEQQISFTFKGKHLLGPGHHQELVRECLRELALC